jgi:hypothetical protein
MPLRHTPRAKPRFILLGADAEKRMPKAFDGFASDVEQLSERVRELEERVSALEGKPASVTLAPAESGSNARTKPRPEQEQSFPTPSFAAGTLPVFGKAVLGIAGAYLLRAVAETGILPKLVLLVVAIVYAGMWLVWAVKTHATDGFASLAYAITSALILSPLLWESTVRFQILKPVFTASVLVAFVVLALVLALRRNLQAIPWVATLAGVATALALIVATRELVPFTVGLMAMALATEAVICFGHSLSVRGIPAIAADFAVWLLVDLMASPEGVPPEYPPIAASTITVLCLALLAIYGASIGLRSFGLHRRITVFEIVQAAALFLIATFGVLRASPTSATPLGTFFLLVAAVCYWGTLSRFTAEAQSRNRRVYATYAVTCLLAGSLLLFPEIFQTTFLCLASVAADLLYIRTGKISLGMHVSVYLVGASILSGLLNLAWSALAGTVPHALSTNAWVVALSAGLCYANGSRPSIDSSEHAWKSRLLWVVPCVLVAGAAAALAVMTSARLGSASGMLKPSHLSVVRTMVICLFAVVLGFCGSRLKRSELVWVAYLAIAFGTLKLVFEDLRFGNTASLVASLLSYGLILILIPWITRQKIETLDRHTL